jgi:hypothetical protein
MKPKKPRNRRKRLDREALPVSALTDPDLAAIANAEVPPEHAYLDDELRSTPDVSQELSVTQGYQRAREGGQMRGKIRIAEDFDAPDPDIEKLFHEGDEP